MGKWTPSYDGELRLHELYIGGADESKLFLLLVLILLRIEGSEAVARTDMAGGRCELPQTFGLIDPPDYVVQVAEPKHRIHMSRLSHV